MGAQKTTAALDRAIVAGDYQLVLSAGLCGAMQPDVKPGDVVADPHEAELELVVPLRETAKALKLPFHFGRILHTNVVLGPEAKRKLGAEHRAAACDMETQAIRRWARGSALAVIGVRAVLDGLDDELPADAPQGEDAASLAAFALSRPAALPGLMRLGWRTGRAMTGLARLVKAYLETMDRTLG
jgi:nucleoside phosphorylase